MTMVPSADARMRSVCGGGFAISNAGVCCYESFSIRHHVAVLGDLIESPGAAIGAQLVSQPGGFCDAILVPASQMGSGHAQPSRSSSRRIFFFSNNISKV